MTPHGIKEDDRGFFQISELGTVYYRPSDGTLVWESDGDDQPRRGPPYPGRMWRAGHMEPTEHNSTPIALDEGKKELRRFPENLWTPNLTEARQWLEQLSFKRPDLVWQGVAGTLTQEDLQSIPSMPPAPVKPAKPMTAERVVRALRKDRKLLQEVRVLLQDEPWPGDPVGPWTDVSSTTHLRWYRLDPEGNSPVALVEQERSGQTTLTWTVWPQGPGHPTMTGNGNDLEITKFRADAALMEAGYTLSTSSA